MSIEENKALARRIPEELFNKGNPAVLDEVCAPDFVLHGAPPPGDKETRKCLRCFTPASLELGQTCVEMSRAINNSRSRRGSYSCST